MQRHKAFYSKKKIRDLIQTGAVIIEIDALKSARYDFGWGYESICDALMKISVSCCYKSETRYDNPEIWVDYYRAENIMGENIYTHFYIENENLIIDSFKAL